MKAERAASSIVQLEDGIFLIPGRKSGGCNIFVLKGSRRIALIDVGLPDDHDHICSSLAEIGLTIDDVSLVILTHEHLDHVGDLPNLPKHILIAAHSRAAIKLQLDDQFAMMSGAFGSGKMSGDVDIHLEDGSLIDLGGIRLRTIYTPGHCSGAICLYEPDRGILFTADTVFAGGTLGGICASGNISDYISSLERLREFRLLAMYPGHGRMSANPAEDLNRAIGGSTLLLSDTRSLFESINVKGVFDQIKSATVDYSRRAAERRQDVRVPSSLQALLRLDDGDHPVSVQGISIAGGRLDREIAVPANEVVSLALDAVGNLQCQVIAHVEGYTSLKFLKSSPDIENLAAWLRKMRQNTNHRISQS